MINRTSDEQIYLDTDHIISQAWSSLYATIHRVSQSIQDTNVLPFMHIVLAYVFSLRFHSSALVFLENFIPWREVARFLNSLPKESSVREFPGSLDDSSRFLPEDFLMRGLIWAQGYFPAQFFHGELGDECERNLELPSHRTLRGERCRWLGFQLALVSSS